ncbi:hypothetical protein HU200_041888 [Digitaria exilis]|uniref:Reverse transcriptase zinc-binding domain-containing protein n=1 Tax=Digitaria exilis TaxID=1010633 RepID=A0A835B6P2_9POAL|nr:hypothetical protein HU200_041888 [Digitaria exilis]
MIGLWGLIQEVELNEQEDEIKWRWTSDGKYSAKSAYKTQLRGSFCTFDSNAIWGAKTVGKHRFFAWLLVQNKILTGTDGMVQVPSDGIQTEEWWNSEMAKLPKNLKRNKATILIYTAWNVWKERNRRVFEGKSASPSAIINLIKEEANIRALALRDEIVQLTQ